MPQSLAKRLAGHDDEIIRDIQLYGKHGQAMDRWDVRDPLAWDKHIQRLKNSGKYPHMEDTLVLNGNGHHSLAEQLVDAFANKVCRLQVENEELKRKLRLAEYELNEIRGNQYEHVGHKMIEVLELCQA